MCASYRTLHPKRRQLTFELDRDAMVKGETPIPRSTALHDVPLGREWERSNGRIELTRKNVCSCELGVDIGARKSEQRPLQGLEGAEPGQNTDTNAGAV